MNKLVRIPETSDYRAAIELEDEVIRAKGGAWVVAMLAESETRSKASAWKKLLITSNVANILEPLNDDNEAYDKNFRATRAFKHGMLKGFDIVETVHNDLIDADGVVGGLGMLFTQQLGETSELHQWQDTLVTFGEEGLARLDEESKAKVEAWSEEYDRQTRFQKLYVLGTGAVIYSGYQIHKGVIEKQVTKETESIDWFELLPPNTGE